MQGQLTVKLCLSTYFKIYTSKDSSKLPFLGLNEGVGTEKWYILQKNTAMIPTTISQLSVSSSGIKEYLVEDVIIHSQGSKQ